MDQKEIEIRPAMSGDLKGILELAESRSLDATSRKDAIANGFLVSGYGPAEYQRLLERAEYFYVALVQEELAGFLVAYGRDRIQEDEWLSVRLGDFFDDFTVIKQVCVSPRHTGRGIATQLYNRVIERNADLNVVSAVVTDPENRPSTGLHRKLGFRPVISITPPDGRPRTVWVRPPRSSRMLEQQLRLAIDLYKHEDLLNWQKLNNFFYVTVGLVALCGISLGIKDGASKSLILLLTGILGTGSAVAFSITLVTGVFYLQYRKEAVKHLEHLAEMRGGSIVLFGRKGIPPRRSALPARSPSNYVGTGWLSLTIIEIVQMTL
jgi:GNAT superfamily N-acetyltransferase